MSQTVNTYRKKQVLVEAFQWQGGPVSDPNWALDVVHHEALSEEEPEYLTLIINGIQTQKANVGDFVVKNSDNQVRLVPQGHFTSVFEIND
jgi:hypothetical protein